MLFNFRPKVRTNTLIKAHSMSLIYKTTHTNVYKGSGVVLKKYRESKAREIYTNERSAMVTIDPVGASTPRLLEFNDSEMFILMEDVGTDGIDLMNSCKMYRSTWEMFYKQIYKALNGLHAQGFIHRDIKPENAAFKNDKWHLIDLAFAGTRGTINKNLVGTYPYTPPMTGNAQMLELFLKHNDKNRVKVANDYFAFALSVITMAIDIRDTWTTESVSLNIKRIHDLAAGGESEVLKACAVLVLSCTDIGYTSIAWKGGICLFEDPVGDPVVTEGMLERNISCCWDRLGTIIENQIGWSDDVQTENKHE